MLRQDYTIVFELAKIGSIKAWKESEIDGNKNPAFVKFRGVNIEEKTDKDVGLRDIETIIDFKVTTPDYVEANRLNTMIREARQNNQVIKLRGNLPNKENVDDILTVSSIIPYQQFLNENPFLKHSEKKAS